MKPIISVKNVSKIYGRGCSECLTHKENSNICPFCGSVVACKNVSFDLYEDEVLGIVGESGSGKSTLVKILYFDEEPTYGEMYVSSEFCNNFTIVNNGEKVKIFEENFNLFNLSSFKKRLLRNQFMGMVYQNPHLGLKMNITVGGNIVERLLMAGWRNIGTMRERASSLLEKTEISVARIDDFPKNFSGGMQQRVQIAKALSNKPTLLFLDEPTTGLDLSVQAKVLDLIKKLQKEMRLATMVVSHDLGIIKLLTKRTMVMKNGVVVESGLTDQILEDPTHAYTQLLVSSTL